MSMFISTKFVFIFHYISKLIKNIMVFRMAPEMMIVRNNPNTSGWSLESGYTNRFLVGNYPLQMHSATTKASNRLSVLLTIHQNDIELQCKSYDKGFKLILSMPGETVETSQNYLRLPAFHQNRFTLQTKFTVTSDGLRGYTPNQRQCYYSSDDHPLRFFKIYTQKNCAVECKANFTLAECGCVKFSMPSKILYLISFKWFSYMELFL